VFGGTDQRVEQRLLAGQLWQVFRVPLHAQHEWAGRMLNCLDDAVAVARRDTQAAPEPVDRLAVQRVYPVEPAPADDLGKM